MPLHVVVAGASGFLGTHLCRSLRERGHQVTTLTRGPSGNQQVSWSPYATDPAQRVDEHVIAAADVVVNLAGSPTLGNPHSQRWADELRRSRVRTTRVLAEAIAAAPTPPAFLAGNGISIYGDHGDRVLTEDADSRGHATLTEVCREWEAATLAATDAGSRVCVIRTAPVMDRDNPPLSQLRLLFKAGLGGQLGDGQQYMPMISLRDWVAALVHLAEHASASGAFNLTCPTPPTNAEFTAALAAAVHRPAWARVPSLALRVAAGRMAPELLGSMRAVPNALIDAGYRFEDATVEQVIAAGLR